MDLKRLGLLCSCLGDSYIGKFSQLLIHEQSDIFYFYLVYKIN